MHAGTDLCLLLPRPCDFGSAGMCKLVLVTRSCLLQVHRAVLHTGEAVVVKVQRPGLKNLFDIDLSNLKVLAQQMDRMDENNDFV